MSTNERHWAVRIGKSVKMCTSDDSNFFRVLELTTTFLKGSLRAFLPLALVVVLLLPQESRGDVFTTSLLLPPPGGEYAGSGVHALFNFLNQGFPFGFIQIVNPTHSLPAPETLCSGTADGSFSFGNCLRADMFSINQVEFEKFKSTVSFTANLLDVDGMTIIGTKRFDGDSLEAETKVTRVSGPGDFSFDNELLKLKFSGTLGGIPFTLEEDPVKVSSGHTDFFSQLGGGFRVTSFFDVFTELTLNGKGPVGCNPCGRVDLVAIVPEPATLTLLGAGLGLLAVGRWRKSLRGRKRR